MLNFSKTKVLSIYLIFLFISIFSFSNFFDLNKFFFNKKVNLGLDLQGGSYLLLEVDSSSLEERRLQSKVVPLKKKFKESSIEFKNFVISEKNIKFNLQEKDLEKFEIFFQNRKGNDINNYLDEYNSFELEHKIVNNQVDIYLSKYKLYNQT